MDIIACVVRQAESYEALSSSQDYDHHDAATPDGNRWVCLDMAK